jgi:hypothetical protein
MITVLLKTFKTSYNIGMDGRKKQITDLEQRNREQTISLDALLTRFGETLFGRADDSSQ